jgi:hypothetical protein
MNERSFGSPCLRLEPGGRATGPIFLRRGEVKKIILGFLVIGILAGGATAQSSEKRVALSLNVGGAYDNQREAGIQATVDARAGFRIGGHLQLSPEVMYAFLSDDSVLSPGVILNYAGQNVFVGMGIVAQFHGRSSDHSSNWAAKLNVGYAKGHLMVTAYFTGAFYSDEYTRLFGSHQIGLTVGYRF